MNRRTLFSLVGGSALAMTMAACMPVDSTPDIVEIAESRPLSRTKSWAVTRVVETVQTI